MEQLTGHASHMPEPAWWKRLWRFITAPQVVYTTSFVLGALLVLVYVLIASRTNEHPHWTLVLVKEVGFAYVVAAILGFSIEKFNQLRHELHERNRQADLEKQAEHVVRLMREEHTSTAASFGKQVARDVIEAAYGATIPKPVIAALSKFVLQPQKIRHDFMVKVELRRLSEVRETLVAGFSYPDEAAREADAKHVVVTYTSRVVDENVFSTATRLPTPVEIIKEGAQIDGIDRLRNFRAYDPDTNTTWVESNSTAELAATGVQIEDSPEKLKFTYTTPEISSRGKAAVVLQYILVQDLDDEMIVMSLFPCVNALLTVVHSASLSVSVSSIHSEAEVELKREPDWGEQERRWTLSTALLPCQGFVLNWRL